MGLYLPTRSLFSAALEEINIQVSDHSHAQSQIYAPFYPRHSMLFSNKMYMQSVTDAYSHKLAYYQTSVPVGQNKSFGRQNIETLSHSNK